MRTRPSHRCQSFCTDVCTDYTTLCSFYRRLSTFRSSPRLTAPRPPSSPRRSGARWQRTAQGHGSAATCLPIGFFEGSVFGAHRWVWQLAMRCNAMQSESLTPVRRQAAALKIPVTKHAYEDSRSGWFLPIETH